MVILSPKNPLPVLLFAQMCAQAGLPEGVVNVVIGDHARQVNVFLVTIVYVNPCNLLVPFFNKSMKGDVCFISLKLELLTS